MDENLKPQNGNNQPNDDSFGDLPQNVGQQQNNFQQPYGQQPYYRQPCDQPVQRAAVKGKPFAILAFVFALVALVFFMSAITLYFELAAAEALADSMSGTVHDGYIYNYEVMNSEVLQLSMKVCAVISLIFAVLSDVFVIFAYIGNAQNVKNGNPVKFIKVFAILATVFANVALIASLIFLL